MPSSEPDTDESPNDEPGTEFAARHWDGVWSTKDVDDVSWYQTSAEP